MMTKIERVVAIKNMEPKFQEIFNNNSAAYAILQLPIDVNYKFRDFKEAVKITGKMPNRKDYRLMYAGIIDVAKLGDMTSSKDIADIIFAIFNMSDRPNEDDMYYGTSVSVSDVIVVKCGKIQFAFYVDTFGFERLVNFEV